ncbi:hypothetical protein [Micromonospora sp. NPDC004704]
MLVAPLQLIMALAEASTRLEAVGRVVGWRPAPMGLAAATVMRPYS